MSETVSAPAPAFEGATNTPAGSDNYEAMLDNLGDNITPETETETEEAPEVLEEQGEDAQSLRLKVNGKYIDKPMSEVIALAQQQLAGTSKLEAAKKQIEEAKATKQQAETQISAVKQMLGVLQRGDIETIAEFAHEKLNAGQAFDKAVIQYALKLYEVSKMSPDQREAIDNKRMVSKLRQEAEDRQKADQQRALEYQINQWQQHLAVEVPKAIKEVGLPDSDFVREHIVSTWRTALEQGKNPTAMAVAGFVKKRLEASKMLHTPQVAAQAPTRPRATPQSVGGIGARNQVESQYSSWDEWKRTRKSGR